MATLIYFALCLLIATLGKNRKFGFWGYFFCSFFLSPAVGALLFIASDPRPKEENKSPDASSHSEAGTKRHIPA
ncbi:hypothetical protein G9409_07275 [Chlorobium sp. BLA1]|uniref:hypothetical protein n=1 Tax=Candidatus Chlorobium masyuteum TaxID=2716876 RepID=UPI00141E2951|nr:hypothetical protein [Candidatus Chlorobium masyuteum]NHQ60393.1 hypothetical protein [Candidatus Chlorobium masyuteum]NTU44032.1 hypothetical protein [Chlorobiaceae bacterium]